MRILLVGAGGTVGKAAAKALSPRHEIVSAGRSAGDVTVDLMSEDSVRAMYAKAGKIDAVVACAGHVHFGPVDAMTPAQFCKGLDDKLMGQINLVLLGLAHVNDGGSFTLTSGVLDRDPVRQGANAAAVNGAIGAFVKAAAIEMPRGIRINAVSPGLLQESEKKYEGFFPGHEPVSSARVGLAYVKSVEGALSGQVFTVG
jgi:NAD(P)-dependent dehydrogenase (short-subunit alcohol dehydrogenase family)